MEEFPLLMEYQKKYGKRGSETVSLWLLRKRTINIACRNSRDNGKGHPFTKRNF